MKREPRASTQSAASVLAALLAVFVILLSTWLLARWFEDSNLYRQSQIFSSIASNEQVDILSILTDSGKRDVLTKFIGAITTAYIDFEMIPYSEGQTFSAIFQSIDEGIHIERFEYKRRDLMVRGWADTAEAYEDFVNRLSGSSHFSSVTDSTYLTVDDTIRFELWCMAGQNVPPILL